MLGEAYYKTGVLQKAQSNIKQAISLLNGNIDITNKAVKVATKGLLSHELLNNVHVNINAIKTKSLKYNV